MKQSKFFLFCIFSMIAGTVFSQTVDEYQTYEFKDMGNNVYGGYTTTQTLNSTVSGWNAPETAISWWNNGGMGSKVDYYFNLELEEGMHKTDLVYVSAHDYSIYDVYVNGVYYTTIDSYSNLIGLSEKRLGMPRYVKGQNLITFVFTGKNHQATAPQSHMAGFKSLKVYTQKESDNTAAQFQIPAIYIVGSATSGGWDTNASEYMQGIGDYVFTWTGILQAGELKFHTDRGSWSPSINPMFPGSRIGIIPANFKLALTNGGHNDFMLYVEKGGKYTIRIRCDRMEADISYEDTGLLASNIYLVGDAAPNGWNNNSATPLVATNGVYSWTGTLKKGHFKFITELGTWKSLVPVIKGNENIVLTYNHRLSDDYQGDYRFVIHQDAQYRVEVNLATRSLKVSPINSSDEKLFMVGDATPNGWSKGMATPLVRLSEGVFKWSGELNKGHFKFLTTIDNVPASDWISLVPTIPWNVTIKISEVMKLTHLYQGDYRFVIEQKGLYDVEVHISDMTMSVKPQIPVIRNAATIQAAGADTFSVAAMTGYAQVTSTTDVAIQRAELINMNGQTVDVIQNTKGEFALGNNTPKGVYIVHIVYGNNQSFQQKVNIR